MEHLDADRLLAGLSDIRRSPTDLGTVELIVRRPAVDDREELAEGRLDTAVGLVGDTWNARASSRTPDESPHPEMQVTLMNARCIALIAGTRDRWALAGDQIYVDLDLSVDNLPAGTLLALGSARLAVTAQPHTGCAKFTQRFGLPAFRFVNSDEGKALRLRGMYARVVVPGVVRRGEKVRRVDSAGEGGTEA